MIVSCKVKISGCKRGSIEINSKLRPGMIEFGFGGSYDQKLYSNNKSLLLIDQNAKVVFNGKAHFSPHFSLCAFEGAYFSFGNNFSCNHSCSFSAVGRIRFGHDVLIGGHVIVRDSDGHQVFDVDKDGTIVKIHKTNKDIIIGNHVWICNKCNILKGTEIDEDNIIAYGSLTTKRIVGKHLLIGGSPAKIIREQISWKR